MCSFSTPRLLRNKSQYEFDAARRCPFYIAAKIEVKEFRKRKKTPWLYIIYVYREIARHTNVIISVLIVQYI
jgi:hypothetical protein